MSDLIKLDFSPLRAELHVVAGDSCGVRVLVDDVGKIPNPVWTGQVRDANGNNAQDWTAVPEASGCLFYLSPTETRFLSQLPGARRVQSVVGVGKSVMLWTGQFDLQVAYDVGMVRTCVKGPIYIEADVTQ